MTDKRTADWYVKYQEERKNAIHMTGITEISNDIKVSHDSVGLPEKIEVVAEYEYQDEYFTVKAYWDAKDVETIFVEEKSDGAHRLLECDAYCHNQAFTGMFLWCSQRTYVKCRENLPEYLLERFEEEIREEDPEFEDCLITGQPTIVQ